MSDEQQVRKEAARWLATLQSGNVDATTEAEFLRWQTADERHSRVMEQLYRHVGTLRESPLRDMKAQHLAATLAAPSRRRFVRGALALTGLGLGGWLLGRVGSTGLAMPGDLYTAIGERHRFTLTDGSLLTLSASSRVTPGERTLRLRQGELLLDIEPSPAGDFKVQTDFCRITGAAKSLLIRQMADTCYTLALDSHLEIQDFRGKRHTLSPQQWLSISSTGDIRQGRANGTETSWLSGLLTVENHSLEDVVERLRPYHRGVLRLDPAVAKLRITGTFPLEDTHHALEMLTQVFPVRLVERTPLWIMLAPS